MWTNAKYTFPFLHACPARPSTAALCPGHANKPQADHQRQRHQQLHCASLGRLGADRRHSHRRPERLHGLVLLRLRQLHGRQRHQRHRLPLSGFWLHDHLRQRHWDRQRLGPGDQQQQRQLDRNRERQRGLGLLWLRFDHHHCDQYRDLLRLRHLQRFWCGHRGRHGQRERQPVHHGQRCQQLRAQRLRLGPAGRFGKRHPERFHLLGLLRLGQLH